MRLRGSGRIVCFDADEAALIAARERLKRWAERIVFVHANVAELEGALRRMGLQRISGFLLDLGVSSYQLDTPTRGFSFRGDERLDMRLDQRQQTTAWDLVNRSDERELAGILRDFGEEREWRRIARHLVNARPVDTTGDLRAVVERAVGGRYLTKTLARVFQALRIAVNHELENLRSALAAGRDVLVPGGRLAVIAYHSLEDRIVKEFFRDEQQPPVEQRHPFVRGEAAEGRLRLLTRKPITPGEDEILRNPRARSAKMRVAERTNVGTERI